MTAFNDGEKALLRDLSMNPTWGGVLRKLAEFHRPVPKYTPDQGTSKEQELDWIYWSGVDRARSDLLKLLGHE